ncbi:MAG: hypothetical protein IPJ14_04435 [Kineosporiaceae bacterium]|nr:hypothetical protein [Kineosporiaceae bacterium]
MGEPLFPALRDGALVAITVLLGLFTLHFTVMGLGIALYLTPRAHLPRRHWWPPPGCRQPGGHWRPAPATA